MIVDRALALNFDEVVPLELCLTLETTVSNWIEADEVAFLCDACAAHSFLILVARLRVSLDEHEDALRYPPHRSTRVLLRVVEKEQSAL